MIISTPKKIVFITSSKRNYYPALILKNLLESKEFTIEAIVVQKDTITNNAKLLLKCNPLYLFLKYLEQKKQMSFTTIDDVARDNHITIIETDNINSDADKLRKFNPDLMVSYIYPQIFGKEIMSISKIVNIHRSELPYLRGVSPLFWSIYGGNETAGITLHEVTKKVDKGNILCQMRVNISESDSVFSLSLRLTLSLCGQIKYVLRDYLDGKLIPIKQKSLPECNDLKVYYSYPNLFQTINFIFRRRIRMEEKV